MFYPMCRIWPVLLLGGFVAPGMRHVSGIEIYTPTEVEAVNGTNMKLKCSFSSSQPVTTQSVIVSWTFRSIKSGPDESVFYYHEDAYPPLEGRFKGKAEWSGNIQNGDASITLLEVPPTFNGTYICQVRNRPDVHGRNGEIVLRVVNKAVFPEIAILAVTVGAACCVILVFLFIFVAVRHHRRKQMTYDNELHQEENQWKEQKVWEPGKIDIEMKKKKEADTSDDEKSEKSSRDY